MHRFTPESGTSLKAIGTSAPVPKAEGRQHRTECLLLTQNRHDPSPRCPNGTVFRDLVSVEIAEGNRKQQTVPMRYLAWDYSLASPRSHSYSASVPDMPSVSGNLVCAAITTTVIEAGRKQQ
jgi:hypothetical protein